MVFEKWRNSENIKFIVNCFKLSQFAIKTRQCHYSPYCTCQLGTFFMALRWLILTPGHNENWQKGTRKVLILRTENFHPYMYKNMPKYEVSKRARRLAGIFMYNKEFLTEAKCHSPPVTYSPSVRGHWEVVESISWPTLTYVGQSISQSN